MKSIKLLPIFTLILLFQACSTRAPKHMIGDWSRTLENGQTEFIFMKNGYEYVLQRTDKVADAEIIKIDGNTVFVKLSNGYQIWKNELGEMNSVTYDNAGNIKVSWSKIKSPVEYKKNVKK